MLKFNDREFDSKQKTRQEGLEILLGKELKEIVITAMRDLRPKYREILALRCYDNLDYPEIAVVMDCSVFGARVMFGRAKKALKSRHFSDAKTRNTYAFNWIQ